MYNPGITITFLAVMVFMAGMAYIIWPRSTKNFIIANLPATKKRYVIVHLIFPNKMSDTHNTVINLQGLTKVGNYSYDLTEKYVSFYTKNRAHYIIDEANAVPRTADVQTKDTILFQAAEIQTALDNTVMDYLFSKKKEILIMGLFAVAIGCFIAFAYCAYELSSINNILASAQETVRVP